MRNILNNKQQNLISKVKNAILEQPNSKLSGELSSKNIFIIFGKMQELHDGSGVEWTIYDNEFDYDRDLIGNELKSICVDFNGYQIHQDMQEVLFSPNNKDEMDFGSFMKDEYLNHDFMQDFDTIIVYDRFLYTEGRLQLDCDENTFFTANEAPGGYGEYDEYYFTIED